MYATRETRLISPSSHFWSARVAATTVSLAAVLLLGAMTSAAQTASVRGTVVDSDDGEILVGANVVLLSDARQGTATTESGTFTIDGLAPGSYRLVVSYVGYQTQELDVHLEAGERRVVDIWLVATDILINPVTVTASRSPQKLLDAPAAITVLEPEEIEARTALSAAEHLKTVPSVDLVSTGINQSRIVIRGFNDNLASSLLTMVDNRIVQLPSLRLTALQLIPISNADIDRIEVVSGPASALYGPNSANGVVHIITTSPFETQGTTATVSIGQNDILSGAIRHSGLIGRRLAYKVFGQYYEGNDFEFADSTEVAERRLALDAGADPDTLLIGLRDFRVRNLALEGRMDYRFAPSGTIIVNAGFTRGENIEVSPTGAVQAKNAMVMYGQARLRYRRLFAQTFYHILDSGDSYALRTGDLFKENSGQFVAQVQHSADVGERQQFTYGGDVSLTRPDSKGTINGRNEDRDDVNEVGVYIQSETRLSRSWEVVGAARLDHHNRVDRITFSPRAAVVFKPVAHHTVRATFNRAFQTPTSNHFFADVLGQRDVFRGAQLEPLLGFEPITDLRAQGTPSDGFHFRRDDAGRPMFRSPYARLDPRALTTSDFVSLDDPVFTNTMWSVARQATVVGLGIGLAESGLITPAQAEAFSLALEDVLPSEVQNVNNALRALDLSEQTFVPVGDVRDVNPLEVTRTETIEVGYKGILSDRLVLGIDLYRTRVENFIGPFLVGTPNVFLDSPTLLSYLNGQLQDAFADPANADALNTLMVLDTLPGLGNRDGSPASELSLLISSGVAGSIPFGTVSPEETFDPTAVLLVRRNFGDVTLYGADAYFTLYLSRRLSIAASYSYMSDNFFEDLGGIDDLALNAPQHKASGSVRYSNPGRELTSEVRFRHVAGFPVRSDVYVGEVEPYTVFDVSLHYRVPFSPRTQLTVTIQNLLDNEHQEFVAVPALGRLALLRLTHTF